MLRLLLDSSKVHTLIVGCPYCDFFDTKRNSDILLIWEHARWMIAHSPSNKHYADCHMINADYCPACSRELPNIEHWRIVPE